mmetsp:Transcript_29905/g.33975  ORF Transcript_29905/g.33975 Transcript_29905/m.33975 type:complete len:293 (+) Transcript_29905:39-917(+)
MAERKVLIKYYPPDFDPTKLPKNKRPRDKQDNVRMMLPMSIRCTVCGNFMYIGTKFNMRKETCLDEDYLGIKIFRFYFKCTRCYAEITFKTDPKNSDYVCEHNGSRNYDQGKDLRAAEALLKEKRKELEMGDAMKVLENKTYDSKREMDILDALEEVRLLNRREADLDINAVLDHVSAVKEVEQEMNDEDIARKAQSVFHDMQGGMKVRRLREDEDEDEDEQSDDAKEDLTTNTTPSISEKSDERQLGIKKSIIKSKPIVIKGLKVKKKAEPKKPAGLSLLGAYSDDDDEDE